mmetsp:Transcript_9808/g.13610  ORF Transcript_9808/g.13610 Transcript_9808/m.13610 type:complete len:302 (-) Transcript_9808:1680-2585(-)|eukprot:CAMPEP_0197295918 /NCGR_PEP_ID=MMETSP0890-20130614/36960_1 /TAXON_ID=44058 ORGANISM="Aureoumbra lagunensis, Strain CCMP1510" /NCGR_SAMPLE_ID=MMETSP0890 /ASSEMBLY_ACC=CAM_ASM_000533 /LENGTH=301 /DNA_ID=CAMNT_0042772177 /DNA_START=186 /DNA_END=1091 /DNA_ORIENTATION=+
MRRGEVGSVIDEDRSSDFKRVKRKFTSRENEVFIGNLSYESTEESVRSALTRFGIVLECRLPKDRTTGQARGFGFVSFQERSEAEAAVKAGSFELDGRQISFRYADDNKQPAKKSTSNQSTRAVWGKPEEDDMITTAHEVAPDAAKPDFGLSGALAKDEATGNTYKGHVLKFTEPADAVAPRDRWRIYVFKDNNITETLHIHRQSAFLVGRIKEICDVLTMHPSCSGQHAVIQFRARKLTTSQNDTKTLVLPYVMDLNSTNGTRLNGSMIEGARYYEIRHKDLLNFGQSSRDYVFVNSSLE